MNNERVATTETKKVALLFLEAFWREDLDEAYTYLTEDAKFLMMPSGAAEREQDARVALKQLVDELFSRFDSQFPLHCEITSMIEEGSDVAVEYIARAKTFRLEPYENFYSAHLTFDGDLIHSVRTYADTLYLNRMLSRSERGKR